jgi:trehalose-phosphatase
MHPDPDGSLSRVQKENPRPLLKCWPVVSCRVRAADGAALFLDFDGTLVNFRPRPDQVKLAARTRAALCKLAALCNVRVVIVSGRRRSSLLQFVNVPGLLPCGLYGWEHREGFPLPSSTMRQISTARAMLKTIERGLPGIYVEDKDISFAVHFRDASPEVERKARARLRKLQSRFRAHLRVIRAGNVWELTPRRVQGKGAALKILLRRMPSGFLPFYVGDDLTDEPAFKALRKGISVIVGSRRPTSASFSLADPAAVCKFLELLYRDMT